MKFSRSRGSDSRPSSSTGRLGNRSSSAAANRPRPVRSRHAARAVHLDPLHPAARRILLQHVAAQVLVGELLDAAARPARHRRRCDRSRVRVVIMRTASVVAHEPQRLARRAHADLDLRAHPDPLHERSERIGEEAIALVAAVEAHLVAEQACGDADADRRLGAIGSPPAASRLRRAVIMISTSPSGANSPAPRRSLARESPSPKNARYALFIAANAVQIRSDRPGCRRRRPRRAPAACERPADRRERFAPSAPPRRRRCRVDCPASRKDTRAGRRPIGAAQIRVLRSALARRRCAARRTRRSVISTT